MTRVNIPQPKQNLRCAPVIHSSVSLGGQYLGSCNAVYKTRVSYNQRIAPFTRSSVATPSEFEHELDPGLVETGSPSVDKF